ncbi:hypothetical protein [Streptomyces sp. NPDC017890]|uniref:hypothetical protein n=1 Tax=Streptomyces sp. NPDC017890 TaxID=3365015 RepID=UPI0037A24715
METAELAAAAIGLLAATVTGVATGVGERTGSEVVQVVRERLGASERGRRALAELEEAPDAERARGEAEAVLRDEVEADAGLRYALTMHLYPPVTQTRGSVVITGGRVSRSQITLGPLTINRPSTTGGLVALAVALVVAVTLIVYGGVQVVTTDDSPGTADAAGGADAAVGKAPAARALSPAETKQVLPALEDMPPDWTEIGGRQAESGGDCHQGRAKYNYQGSVPRFLAVEFEVYACRETWMASEGYKESLAEDASQKPAKRAISMPRFGDESRTTVHTVEDDYMLPPGDAGDHVVSWARVGNVVIEMKYGPVEEQEEYPAYVEELMRIVADRARQVQASG